MYHLNSLGTHDFNFLNSFYINSLNTTATIKAADISSAHQLPNSAVRTLFTCFTSLMPDIHGTTMQFALLLFRSTHERTKTDSPKMQRLGGSHRSLCGRGHALNHPPHGRPAHLSASPRAQHRLQGIISVLLKLRDKALKETLQGI